MWMQQQSDKAGMTKALGVVLKKETSDFEEKNAVNTSSRREMLEWTYKVESCLQAFAVSTHPICPLAHTLLPHMCLPLRSLT